MQIWPDYKLLMEEADILNLFLPPRPHPTTFPIYPGVNLRYWIPGENPWALDLSEAWPWIQYNFLMALWTSEVITEEEEGQGGGWIPESLFSTRAHRQAQGSYPWCWNGPVATISAVGEPYINNACVSWNSIVQSGGKS